MRGIDISNNDGYIDGVIMINDAKTSSADKKNIEEQILRSLYMNY